MSAQGSWYKSLSSRLTDLSTNMVQVAGNNVSQDWKCCVKLNKYWSIVICVNIGFEALEALETHRGALLAHQQHNIKILKPVKR